MPSTVPTEPHKFLVVRTSTPITKFVQAEIERFRFRVNATGCQVEGHDGIQIISVRFQLSHQISQQ